ncbi:uncharacterized protein [Diabrotica undecimpunctata]|uniref:uncharacterized protein n=1 Tax=Diabrotica undecimpunctata TaxID=50387 RepID=UPI003B633364
MSKRKTLYKMALRLEEEEKVEPRREWVHKIFLSSREEGNFAKLYPQLVDDETKFVQYFRMSHCDFLNLLSLIKDVITKIDTHYRRAVTPAEKLAVRLRFLLTGDSFVTLSYNYRLGHSTVHSIVREVCGTIVKNCLRVFIPMPSTEDWTTIAHGFETKWNFPNCIGAIDGKHCEIFAPHNIVLLALVDANYEFIAVDVGSYGKNSDGGIFSSSRLGIALEEGSLNIPSGKHLPGTNISTPLVILGDQAFPLKTYMLRPYPSNQVQEDPRKRIFNYRHCTARRTVENAFGLWAQRFRIYYRKINSQPGYIENIILATCILHNYILGRNNSHYLQNSLSDEERVCVLESLPGFGLNARLSAFDNREKFTA